MNVYWIRDESPRLGIIPRPRGWDWLEGDIDSIQKAGIDVVVSALMPSEVDELGLADEPSHCQALGIEFFSFPIEDRGIPDCVDFYCDLIRMLNERLNQGKSVAVHCRAGIGRSSTMVASVLIAHGLSVESAFREIETARGCAVPDTPEQRKWIERHATRFKA